MTDLHPPSPLPLGAFTLCQPAVDVVSFIIAKSLLGFFLPPLVSFSAPHAYIMEDAWQKEATLPKQEVDEKLHTAKVVIYC